MNVDEFRFRRSGRRPATVAAFIAAAAFALFGVANGAPLWWLLPVGFALVALAWMVFANPQATLTLGKSGLCWSDGGNETRIALSEIAHVRFRLWTDGPDSVEVVLHNGVETAIPSACAPPKADLVAALKLQGVSVE